jgi:peptidoglycan/xylan/chitin deacetylase (PgdA/CDA1 family)
VLCLLGALVLLLGGPAAPASAQADDTADQASAGADSPSTIAPEPAPAPPWTRSIVCPVLYTHEVSSQVGMRQIVLGLVGAGYHPTSLHAVDLAMSGLDARPPGCLVLSFDDALYSQYANALPVLAALRAPAVFFVLPNFADGVHRYMGVNEIRTLSQAGLEVEAHTCNHPRLPLLARVNYPAFMAEVVDCKRIVEDFISQPVSFLAYPYGTYDATVLDGVARAGYRGAFTTRPTALLTAGSPYTLPRIEYSTTEAPARVIARIRAAGG